MAQEFSYPVCAGGFSPVVMRPEPEPDHSIVSNAEVKMQGAVYPIAHIPSSLDAELNRGAVLSDVTYVSEDN